MKIHPIQKLKLNIKQKLTLIIMVSSSIALLLACAGIIVYDQMTYKQVMRRKLDTLAEIIGNHCTAALIFEHEKDARETLSTLLKAEKYIVFASLYDKNDKIFARYKREGVATTTLPPLPEEEGSYFEKDYLILFQEIMLEGERIGKVYIQSNLGEIKARLKSFIIIVIVVLIISFLVSYLMTAKLQRIISEPIFHLANVAREVSLQKDYSIRAEKSSQDELGFLTERFNEMLVQIQDREDALQKAHNELEIRAQELQKELTERKQAEEELKTSEEKYRILTEGAPIGIYTSDCEGNFLYGNKMAEEIFGFGREELVGKNLVNLKLLSLSDVNKITELLTLSKLGKETEPHEFTLNRNDGSKVIIRNHNRLLTISGEKLVLTMVEDITERKRSEEQIKASLKEKEVLLKEIHHRVRSMALIHEKLYQSKDMANIDFSEYVQSLTTYLFHSYGVKTGTISMNLSIDNVLLGVDKAIPCGLIINELVSNSLKYAFPNGNKGEINIQLYSDNDNHVIMNIDDNGVGIPEDIDFQKTKTLGLQLVNILTRQLKGTIKLDHEEGTRFEIVFAR
jgi:PAS domain S-box-containing protein